MKTEEKLKQDCAKRKAERIAGKENTRKAKCKPNKNARINEKCKYYNKQVFKGGLCDKGINVRVLVGGHDNGWLNKIPCFTAHKTHIGCSCLSV